MRAAAAATAGGPRVDRRFAVGATVVLAVLFAAAAGFLAAEEERVAASVIGIAGPLVAVLGALAVWVVQQEQDARIRQQRAVISLRAELETSLISYCSVFAPRVADAMRATILRRIEAEADYFPIFTATSDSQVIEALGADLLTLPRETLFWLVAYQRADKAFSAVVAQSDSVDARKTSKDHRRQMVERIYACGEVGLLSSLYALREVREVEARRFSAGPSQRAGLRNLPITQPGLKRLMRRHRAYSRGLARGAFTQ